MKQVFLIHAHKDLQQLNALVDQLCDEDFLIYVNVDRKSALDVRRLHPAAVLVRKRIDIYWGDFSQVQATLDSLTQIDAEVPDFDKVTFLSAQDYPLLSNAAMKRALADLTHHELLDIVAIGEQGWSCAHRYQYFSRPATSPLPTLAYRIVNRAMRAGGLKRAMPGLLAPWGGSSWWALSRGCIRMILATVRADPPLLHFFRTVDCPDELFFQTMVMNSPYASRVLGNHFRYVQWPSDGARNPVVLGADDFDNIVESGAHFCRKIDPAHSAALLPLLHAHRAHD